MAIHCQGWQEVIDTYGIPKYQELALAVGTGSRMLPWVQGTARLKKSSHSQVVLKLEVVMRWLLLMLLMLLIDVDCFLPDLFETIIVCKLEPFIV